MTQAKNAFTVQRTENIRLRAFYFLLCFLLAAAVALLLLRVCVGLYIAGRPKTGE